MSLDTQYASASASIREATPDTTDPESQYIRLDGAATEIRGLLDVEHGIPPGQDATVISAWLYLYKAATWSGAADLTFEPIDDPWDPHVSTWNNQPGVRAESEVVSVASGGQEGDEIAIDISSLISTAVAADDAAGSRWFGLRITSSASGQRLLFSPDGPEEYRPKLDRDYNVAPDAPEIVGPDNGQAASEVKPVLVGTFNDDDGDDTIAGIQVQVDDSIGFGSLHYDSGQVSHNEPVFDTNSPPGGAGAMTALTPGTTYYWRMKVKDNHGAWSDWSATAEFVVIAKDTLAITFPSGATVDTPTPTFTHTFSGTQDQVEVEVQVLEDGIWFTHWETPWHVASTLSFTLPDDYALEETEEYAYVVKVLDDEDRADLPGDRAYYEDRVEFTYEATT